ncbi:MAG TPA: hypothetical protein VNT23_03520 [Gaiellaceae bacterium]|nr:hypothetical protein [Gaiellaceae bacterium]
MSPNFRKVALIAASLGLLVSLFVALREDDDGADRARTTPAATTAATTQEATPPTLEAVPGETEPPAEGPVTVRITVSGGQPQGGIARPSVRRGREVRLVVASDVADHVHVHGYDLFADVAPGSPAELTFTADVPGRFEIELEDSGLYIADLEVRP